MQLYERCDRDAALADRGVPDPQQEEVGSISVVRFGRIAVVFLELSADERLPHLCHDHVHASFGWQGALPSALHRRGLRCELFVRASSSDPYTYLGEGGVDVHRQTSRQLDSLQLTFGLRPEPPRAVLAALGVYGPRTMHWLAASEVLGAQAVDSAIDDMLGAVRRWSCAEADSIEIWVRAGGAIVSRGSPDVPDAIRGWRRDGDDVERFRVVASARTAHLRSLQAYDAMERELARHPMSYRESAQLSLFGVAVHGDIAFARYTPRQGMPSIDALRSLDARDAESVDDDFYFLMLTPTHEARRIRGYAPAVQARLDRASALAGMRAYLATGEPEGLAFPGAWSADDREAGLPLVR